MKIEWARKMEGEYESLCKKQEQKLQKEFQTLNKKINQAERNMVNKVKIMQETSKLMSSQANTTKAATVDQKGADSKQLKARIANVEKSYEFAKQKIKTLEEENAKKDAEIKKQGEDIVKLKNQKNKLLKDFNAEKEQNKEKLKVEDLIPTRDHDLESEMNQSIMSAQP